MTTMCEILLLLPRFHYVVNTKAQRLAVDHYHSGHRLQVMHSIYWCNCMSSLDMLDVAMGKERNAMQSLT